MTPARILRLAALASGGGSNLQAILDHIRVGTLPARIFFVCSNNSGAGALARARTEGVPAFHVSARTEGSGEAAAARLIRMLDEHSPDLLVLAGYMKKVPCPVLERMKNRVINIHPSLLPEFGGAGLYGDRVHDAVVRAGVSFTGMTVHMVNGDYDKGQIVLQRRVAVPPDATAAEVGRRVLRLEHDSYWRVLKAFADGDIVPTASEDPARAVRINPDWSARMRAMNGIVP